ncbi:MAG: HEAT repeat domain-containing protein [Planctomycetota bacterium]|jgi:HEAT repeat protein
MRALLILLLAGAVVFAQGRKRKPVFEIPEDQKKPPPERKVFDHDALTRTIQRLGGWPNDRARKAAERLIVQKEKSLPLVLEVLVSAEPADATLKPGAAYVIGRVGEKTHALTLLLVAAEKPQQRHAAVFFEAAWRLQPEQTVSEAFRFFHLAETTLRHQATKFVLDRVSRDNLPAIHDLLDRRKAERPFTREIGLRLLDRLVETKQVDWKDAGPYFYRALGDESPQVSSRAMRLLAGRNDPENIKELNHLVTKELSYWRQRSYAALALSLLSSAYKVQPFEPETLEVLRGAKGLEHPKETLAQASAALALAQAALRTNDKTLVKLLDREVPIVLIDAVGARRHHYRDFGSVMPLAYAMLRRITGQTFADHAPVWSAWWRDNGRRFRAKRELITVDKEELSNLEIELGQPATEGGKRVRLTVVGKQRPTFLHGRAYAIPPEDMQRLADLLRGYGFFDAPEADRASAPSTAALVVMRVGDLDRIVAYDIGEGKTEIRDTIRARVEDLVALYAWQAWWDLDEQPSWQLFFVQNRKWFNEHPDPNERAERLRAMVTGALNEAVDPAERLYGVRFLADLPGGGGALKEGEVEAIVEAVAAEREANEFQAATVDLLIPHAGARAAELLIGALSDKIGPTSLMLLIRVCKSLPPEHVARLVTDPRWKVRRAAIGALAQSEAEGAAAVLRKSLADEEISVRAAAAEALARRKDPAALSTLAELSGSTMPTVRGTAAYSYGLLGSPQGRKGIQRLLYQDRNPEVRIRAIRGLEESGDPLAPKLILGVFKGESDLRVRAAAANALVGLENPGLVDHLIETLQLTDGMAPERVAIVAVLARFESDKPLEILRAVLAGDDQVSADAAALGLARRWEDAALIQLIKMIKNGARERTAVRHLQLLTSRAFDNAAFKRQAENYEGWATTHATGNPRIWYRDALDERGYDTEPLEQWVRKKELEAVPDEAVPVLLSAVRDNDWYIQRNASFLLGRRMGEGAPETITFSTSPADAEAAIRAYNDWWSNLSREKRAEEEG